MNRIKFLILLIFICGEVLSQSGEELEQNVVEEIKRLEKEAKSKEQTKKISKNRQKILNRNQKRKLKVMQKFKRKGIDLTDALRIAENHSEEIKIVKSKLKQNISERDFFRSKYVPHLTVDGAFATKASRAFLRVDQLIWDGGVTSNNIKLVKQTEQTNNWELSLKRQEIRSKVRESYYRLLLIKKINSIKNNMFYDLNLIIRQAERARRLNVISEEELELVRIDKERLSGDQEAAKIQLSEVLEQLRGLLGDTTLQESHFVGELTYQPVDFVKLDKSRASLLKNLNRVKQIESLQKENRIRREIALGQGRIKSSFNYLYGRRNTKGDNVAVSESESKEISVGAIVIKIPLFDGFANSYQKRIFAHNDYQLRKTAEIERREILNKYRQLKVKTNFLETEMRRYDRLTNMSYKIYRDGKNKFKSGLIKARDLSGAINSYFGYRIKKQELVYEYILGLLDFSDIVKIKLFK